MKVFRFVAVAITIIIIAVSLIVPFIMGKIMRSQFEHVLQKQHYPANVNVKLVSYDAGWFYSHAKVRITFNLESKNSLNLQLKQIKLPVNKLVYMANLKIINSPFVELHFTPEDSQFFVGGGVATGKINLLNTDNIFSKHLQGFSLPWDLYLGIGTRGKISLYVSHPAMKYTNVKAMFNLDVGALHWWAYANSDNHWRGSAGIDGITASFLSNIFRISAINVTFDARQKDKIIWTGTSMFSIPEISLVLNAKPVLMIKNLSLNSSTNVANGKLEVTQNASFNKLDAYDFFQGPCTTENIYELNLYKGLEDLILLMQQYQKEGKQIPPQLLKNTVAKAAQGFRVETSGTCNGDFGNYTLKGWFQLPDVINPNIPNAFHTTLKASQAHYKFSMKLTALADSVAMSKRIQASKGDLFAQKFYKSLMMFPFFVSIGAEQGYLIKQGDIYVSTINLSQGELFVNEKKIYPRPPKPTVKNENDLQLHDMLNQGSSTVGQTNAATPNQMQNANPQVDATSKQDSHLQPMISAAAGTNENIEQ